MFPLDYLLAAALLAAPPDSADPDNHYASLCPTMQTVALGWEVLDPREVNFVLARPEDYKTDVNLLRRRYSELADAPPLHDCMRFPPRSVVSEFLSFNRAYREHLEKRRSLDPSNWWEYQEALNDAERLYQLWDAIRDTRCEYYYITVRRQALKKVRDTIGAAAYYNGNFPPHVPVWRFVRID